jgi:predicted MFS family arabinose efflux permease
MSNQQLKVGSKAWVISLVTVFGGISLALVQNKVSPVITVLIDTFQISMATAGLLSSIFTVMGMVMALPAAIILKKMGPKMAGVLALGCAIVGSVVGLLSDNVALLIVSRVIEGSGVGIIAVLAPAVISMWFPPEKRGLPMGIWGSWMMISQTVLFFASTPIVAAIGWQGMWYLGLGSCVIAVVLFLLLVQSPPAQLNNAPVENTDISLFEGLKSAPSWLLAISAACFTFCSFTFVSWVTPYWTEVTGWPIESTRNWVSLLYFVEIIYAVIVGFILNKVRKRKELGIVGFAIYGVVGLFAFLVTQSPLVVALVFVFPIFDALIPCICWVVGPETAKNPVYIGISLGILNIGLNLGTLLSAPISGWLVEQNGWPAAGWCFLAAAILGGIFMLLVRVATPKKETEL